MILKSKANRWHKSDLVHSSFIGKEDLKHLKTKETATKALQVHAAADISSKAHSVKDRTQTLLLPKTA